MQQLERRSGELRGESELATDLEILYGICHAFGSSPDLDEACASVDRWVRQAVSEEPTNLAIFIRDAEGGLSFPDGRCGGDDLPPAVRHAFKDKTPMFLHEDSDWGVALLPLVCRGDAVGVIQVSGPPAAVLRAWKVLETICSQFAMVLKKLEDRERASKDLSTLEQVTTLMQEIVKLNRPEDAVRVVMDACHLSGYKVAAWVSETDSDRLRFLGVRGLGKEGRNNIRSQMPLIDREEFWANGGRQCVTSRFAAAVGVQDIVVLGTKSAILALAGVRPGEAASLKILEELLEDVLGHVGVVALAHERNENLDLGLAWAAHEIKQPLVSVKMFVDRLMQMPTHSDEERAWLGRSFEEIERVISLIGDLLRWSAGGEIPNAHKFDLGALAEEVVRSFGSSRARILFDRPDAVIVSGDSGRLSAAIRNLIHNALSYSAGEVEVSVSRDEKNAVVSVKDHGPGVPPSERRKVFDPFVRGDIGLVTRQGSGLGLFIARQVAKAHHGAIWLESRGKGSVFKIGLPAESI